jgi:hypothetical protein
MGDFEKAWALARDQILEDEKLAHLLVLSHAIESASFKYTAFSEMLETCDSDIFIMVPCLAILKNLINESNQ